MPQWSAVTNESRRPSLLTLDDEQLAALPDSEFADFTRGCPGLPDIDDEVVHDWLSLVGRYVETLEALDRGNRSRCRPFKNP